MGMKEELEDASRELKKAVKQNAKLTQENEDVAKECQELSEQNDALKISVADLMKANETMQTDAAPAIKYTRGKLPGEKLIKIDQSTGTFEEIQRAEWDLLQ